MESAIHSALRLKARWRVHRMRCAELGLEAFWIDACWYGTVGNSKAPEDGWAANAGNWFYNRQNFPDGLARIGEAVAHEGMDFVVWFEPERVYQGSMIQR